MGMCETEGQSCALRATVRGRGSLVTGHSDMASSASMPGEEVCFAKFRTLERSETVQDTMWKKAAICRWLPEGFLQAGTWMTAPINPPFYAQEIHAAL